MSRAFKIGVDEEVNGYRVRLDWCFWQGEKWYQVQSTGNTWQPIRWLTIDGRWASGYYIGYTTGEGNCLYKYVEQQFKLFKTIEEVELALAKWALTEGRGTSPYPYVNDEPELP